MPRRLEQIFVNCGKTSWIQKYFEEWNYLSIGLCKFYGSMISHDREGFDSTPFKLDQFWRGINIHLFRACLLPFLVKTGTE